MQTTVTEVPLQEFLAAGTQPEVVFDKLAADVWMVPASPIAFDGSPVSFSRLNDGDLVRIPLFAYRTRDRQLHTLVGFALELGVQTCLQLPTKPGRLHIAIGQPVLDLAPQGVDGFRVHLGFGFTQERRT